MMDFSTEYHTRKDQETIWGKVAKMGMELQPAVVGSSPDFATNSLHVLANISPSMGLSLPQYIKKEVGTSSAVNLRTCGKEDPAKLHWIHSSCHIPNGKCIHLNVGHEETTENNSDISLRLMFLLIEIFMTFPRSHCRLLLEQKFHCYLCTR